MNIISRADAIANGDPLYFTGQPCRQGHIAPRRTGPRRCVECERETLRKWRAVNPGRAKELNRQSDARRYPETKSARQAKARQYKATHREQIRAARRAKYKTDEVRKATNRKWRQNNIERAREIERASRAAEDQRNPGARLARSRQRDIAKIQRTPPWADLEAIKEVYRQAALKSRETGQKHHVDHIFPLQGESSCGLHVHYNLQVLPARENLSKGNRMPEIASGEPFRRLLG